MTIPRDYPDELQSAESGRPLRRGVKALTIVVDGQSFTYGQPGWWASLDDPADTEGQLINTDNEVRAAARREARAAAKHTVLTPLVIRAIREACGLSQRGDGAVAAAGGETAGIVRQGHKRTDGLDGGCGGDPADSAGEFGWGDLR